MTVFAIKKDTTFMNFLSFYYKINELLTRQASVITQRTVSADESYVEINSFTISSKKQKLQIKKIKLHFLLYTLHF